MKSIGQATTEMAARYFRLFVNRLAYTVQSTKPDGRASTTTIVPKVQVDWQFQPFGNT